MSAVVLRRATRSALKRHVFECGLETTSFGLETKNRGAPRTVPTPALLRSRGVWSLLVYTRQAGASASGGRPRGPRGTCNPRGVRPHLSSGVFLCSLLARRCSTRSMTSQHDGDGIDPLLFDDVYEFRCARNKLEVTRSIDNPCVCPRRTKCASLTHCSFFKPHQALRQARRWHSYRTSFKHWRRRGRPRPQRTVLHLLVGHCWGAPCRRTCIRSGHCGRPATRSSDRHRGTH